MQSVVKARSYIYTKRLGWEDGPDIMKAFT